MVTYTFSALAAKHTLSAEMAEDITMIDVTFTRDNNTRVNSGYYTINNGTQQAIQWNTAITLNVGDVISFKAIASRGNEITGYSIIDSDRQETIKTETGDEGSYTASITNVDISFTSAAKTARTITFTRDNNTRVSSVKYGIDTTANTDATWNTGITVYAGEEISFKATAGGSSSITGFIVKDADRQETISTGTGSSGSVIISDKNIEVYFESVTTRTVTFKKDSGITTGTYYLNGTLHTIPFNTPISCVMGDGLTFAVNAETGKVVVGFTIKNSTTQSLISEGSGPNGSYQVGAANVDITFSSGYQITVTQPTNGTITPGTSSYVDGSTPTFTITPDTGYHVEHIYVDDNEVQPDS